MHAQEQRTASGGRKGSMFSTMSASSLGGDGGCEASCAAVSKVCACLAGIG